MEETCKEKEKMLNDSLEALNVYAKALSLATSDISKISSQNSMLTALDVKDFYLNEAKKELEGV